MGEGPDIQFEAPNGNAPASTAYFGSRSGSSHENERTAAGRRSKPGHRTGFGSRCLIGKRHEKAGQPIAALRNADRIGIRQPITECSSAW